MKRDGRCFFDRCGTKWEYEPEGFELDNGLRYLPDFRIRNVRICHSKDYIIPELFVEVKGVMNSLDRRKIEAFCYGEEDTMHPIFIVGKLPEGEDLFHICWDAKEIREQYDYYWDVPLYDFQNIDGDYYTGIPSVDKSGVFTICGIDYLDEVSKYRTLIAYDEARQARFW